MTFKNSIRILSSNFSLCWKQLLWVLISWTIVCVCAALTVMPVFDMLKDEGFFTAVADCFEDIYTSFKSAPKQFTDLINMFFNLISTNAKVLWPSYLGFILVLLILGNLARGIGLYACSSVITERMASNADIGFTNRLISTLGKSTIYSLSHIIIAMPFYLATIGLIYAYVKIANTVVLTFALMPVFGLLIYLLISIKVCLFTCMLPQMIDGEKNPFLAFIKGVKEVGRRFWRTFSNSICVVLTIALINGFIGIFTLGAGLLITIPASIVFIATFGMVTHYAALGRNFYVSEMVVVNIK